MQQQQQQLLLLPMQQLSRTLALQPAVWTHRACMQASHRRQQQAALKHKQQLQMLMVPAKGQTAWLLPQQALSHW
jgi:hypothetical protein